MKTLENQEGWPGWIYLALLAISLAWMALIIGAPLLIARGHLTLSLIIYQSFSPLCHQIAERSWHLHGFQLAVCSRCTGIYAGFLTGLIIYPAFRRLDDERFPGRGWLIAAGAPLLVDFLGYLGLFSNTHLSRTATGLLFGAVVSFFILPGLVATFGYWQKPVTGDG